MPRTLIIDTDPGVDDVLAILLALASPEVDVRLISIVFGNTHAPMAHKNLRKIYHTLTREFEAFPEAKRRYVGLQREREKGKGKGRTKTKLAIGGDGPVGGEKAVAAYFHGKDGLSNLSESHPHFTPPERQASETHDYLDLDDRPSWEVMLEVLEQEEEGSVVVVALGPLTNLAQALRSNPRSFSRLGGIVWMGGALDHPGNTSPSAEFNCFADPFAAAEIVDAAKAGLVKLVMAPLDITTPHQIPFTDLIHPSIIATSPSPEEVYAAIRGQGEGRTWAEHPTPIEAFVGAMLLRVRGLQKSFGLPDAMEMHDPVAVWYALCAASLPDLGTARGEGAGTGAGAEGWSLKQRDFNVERIGELTRGMCVVDRRGTGEEGGGEDRTKGELGKGESQVAGKAKTSDEKRLPWVMTSSPGKEVLRKLLLERVFGWST